MFSLIKLFKALNSAGAEYQLALALVFGMMSGFLPFFSAINLFIIFLVFSINIPLGIYGIFTVFFSILGSILDPLFHQIGLTLLTNPSLNELWTSLYNTPIALWFNFNHTITLGSFLVASVLFIPLYFISKTLLKKYRDMLHTQFKDKKFLSWLNPYTEEKLAKKKGFIRWWGSGLFIALTSFIIVFLMVLLDPIIKKSLEYSLSKTGATVTIDEVSSSIVDSNLQINKLSIVKDNYKHTIDNIHVDINGDNFLRKKLDIKLIDIHNVSLDQNFVEKTTTKETVSSATSSNKKEKTDKKQQFSLDLPNIDTLLANEDLKSIKEAKEIKNRFEQINAKWEDVEKTKLNKERFSNIQKEYNEIKQLTQNIKSAKDVQEIAKKTKALQKELNSLQKDIQYYQKEYNKDKSIIEKDFKSVKTLPKQDYDYLSSKYTFNETGALNIVSTYISEDISGYTQKALEYYKLIKPYLPSSQEDPEVIRKKGKWIEFKEYQPYPNFVLQKLQANVVSKSYKKFLIEMKHKNELTNIKMLTLAYTPKRIDLDGNLHLNKNSIDIISNIKIEKFNDFSSESKINFAHTQFKYNKIASNTDQIINNIVKDIHSFYINIISKGTIDNIDKMKLDIKSDIDKLLKKGFDKEIKKQLAKYKSQLKDRLEDEVKQQLGDATGNDFKKYSKLLESNSFSTIKKELQDKYSQEEIQQQLQDKLNKELEKKKQERLNKAKKKLKKEQKKKQKELEDKLKNKLKSLF